MADGLETFAKVRALHDSTTHAGEKANAASRMEALARKAGFTVEEAMSKLDAQKRTASRSYRAGRNQASDSWKRRQEEAHRRAEEAQAEARRRAEAAEVEASGCGPRKPCASTDHGCCLLEMRTRAGALRSLRTDRPSRDLLRSNPSRMGVHFGRLDKLFSSKEYARQRQGSCSGCLSYAANPVGCVGRGAVLDGEDARTVGVRRQLRYASGHPCALTSRECLPLRNGRQQSCKKLYFVASGSNPSVRPAISIGRS